MNTSNFLVELTHEVPDFSPDPEYLEDGLTYPIVNDFARYICSTFQRTGSLDTIAPAIDFIERACLSGDPEIVDLIQECLETMDESEQMRDIEAGLKPTTLRLLAWMRDGHQGLRILSPPSLD